jgi:hypothetical protein
VYPAAEARWQRLDVMSGERSGHLGKNQSDAGPNRRGHAFSATAVGLAVVVLGSALLASGCKGTPQGTTDPPAKVRLEKIFQFYQTYTNQRKKPPPNEAAFKDFLRALPAEEKKAGQVGDDVDAFLVSPRDHEKYVIRYGMVVNVGGETRAVAWEKNGADGMRFVALSVGYVQECDEDTFRSYKK